MDRITTTRFLVDTGAACSVIPQTIAGCGTSSHSSVQGNIFLPTIGGGRLITSALFPTKLDLGFSRFFSFTFYISSQLDYGILGADFLAHHQLCVNVASQRLIENLEVQRSSPEDSSSLPAEYGISSGDTSQAQLVKTLRDEFSNVFEGDKRLRCIRHSVIADVHTLTKTPISLSARRLNPKQYQALKVELKRLIDQGVLERSQSPWTSPIVLVKKKSGGWRLCADFTQLNKLLKIQKYAIPNINDFASIAHGCKWFSSIDIADAYYNIPVNPLHKHKLTITTPLGNYCYNYLPMGLSSSSCYYQRLMNEVVSGLPQVYCYLDDLIIMSQNYDEHVQVLRQVFSRLCEHGLVVKESKCFFAVHSLSFLGYQVFPKGLAPLPSKVSAIKD